MPYKDLEKRRECQRKASRKSYFKDKSHVKACAKRAKITAKRYIDGVKEKGKCSMCGEAHVATLVFHHINPKEKLSDISSMAGQGNCIATINREMEKCVILCANCHRKLHYNLKQ